MYSDSAGMQSSAVPLDRPALESAVAELGLTLSGDQLGLFDRYAGLLVEANRGTNLTPITDPAGNAIRHFADSLSLCRAWQPNGAARLIDVGAGAGLPGLALNILWPRITLTVVESTGK